MSFDSCILWRNRNSNRKQKLVNLDHPLLTLSVVFLCDKDEKRHKAENKYRNPEYIRCTKLSDDYSTTSFITVESTKSLKPEAKVMCYYFRIRYVVATSFKS